MLSNDAVMREVGLAGPLLEKAAKGLIHVNLATISVAFARELQAAHRRRVWPISRRRCSDGPTWRQRRSW